MPLTNAALLSKKRCLYPIQVELKYATTDNLVGRPLNGYQHAATDIILMTPKAAEQLCQVQNYLIKNFNYSLVVYDAYRPRRAVLDFFAWAQQLEMSATEQQRKAIYYPNIQKQQLFELGYIDKDSGHCYGNTVDVFLVDLTTHQILDMGVCYDYMDKLSHLTVTANEIGEKPYQHRAILREAMEKFNFESYQKEFWHYSHGGIAGREISHPLDIEITRNLSRLSVVA